MKRLIILVLLVSILALTMISCDADMRSSLSGFMSSFNNNVYVDAGWVTPNTAQAEEAINQIAQIGSDTTSLSSGDTTKAMGIDVTVSGDTVILKPQGKGKQDELKDNLSDAFNSPTQTQKLLNELNKPASDEQKAAAKGTIEVFNKTLDALKNELDGAEELGNVLSNLKLPEIGDDDDLTQGDMLMLQLMTDLISNTVDSLGKIGGDGGVGDVDDKDFANHLDDIMAIINDALFVADMAENMSGAASIDFTGQLDLGALMDSLNDDRGSRSRGEPIKLDDAEDFLGIINSLAKSLTNLMGMTFTNSTKEFKYADKAYQSFLINQQAYRSSMEEALALVEMGGINKKAVASADFDASTIIKYTLSVIITEHHDFWFVTSDRTQAPNKAIEKFFNESENWKLGRGELTVSDELILPDEAIGLDYENWGAHLYGKGKPYIEAIFRNIITINDIGGIGPLSDTLDEFLSGDDFNDWFESLNE